MTREITIWYKCLFCTRVYPKAPQLVEHRKLHHAEEWKKRKLAKKIEKLIAEGFTEEVFEEKGDSREKKLRRDSDAASNSTISIRNESESETDEYDETISDDNSDMNDTQPMNMGNEDDDHGDMDSETETSRLNDDSPDQDSSVDESTSTQEDCKIVFKNSLQKKLELKLTKCDQLISPIRIKKEILEKPDTTEDNIPDTFVQLSSCLKESPVPIRRQEKVFKLFKCEQCTKQFLHKWGLKLHQEVHSKRYRKK